ncbi:MAG: DUF4143 domain-containing protein, partial [Nanoarchaeota archaeon]|nr:DUF4143 domain-containing protein [Nanoarchaeota archaeon]
TGIYLMTNICNPLSIRNLRNISGLGIQTISEYISFMAEAYLIYQVSIYSSSLKVQSANPKKIYSIDTGLRNAVSFKFSEDIGRLAENVVFIELKRRGKEVFYWKDETGGEVDFIIKKGLKPSEAIQVCWNLKNEGTINREIKPLCNALNKFKLDAGLIITDNLEKEETIDGKKIVFVPLWKWLLSK